ncbi:hypothetical protein EVAR_27127_1 [Eumeta japonica]|uniref:Uncharacterized protein n=1 Tax=Eumeta variegata TaxID=151549 RepID=A0A4C1W0C1_EUMVA|nr:hypothetical protein EVAR_27127_1 [Eumeta japonica]
MKLRTLVDKNDYTCIAYERVLYTALNLTHHGLGRISLKLRCHLFHGVTGVKRRPMASSIRNRIEFGEIVVELHTNKILLRAFTRERKTKPFIDPHRPRFTEPSKARPNDSPRSGRSTYRVNIQMSVARCPSAAARPAR